jgi:hypothetical protein
MRQIKQFIVDSGLWGVASEIAALFVFVIGLLERFRGKPLSAVIFFCLSIPLFWIGAYAAWLKKYKVVARIEKERTAPELFLTYIPVPEKDFIQSDKSGFFLQIQGTSQAANVSITSEECIGLEHTRLLLEWNLPSGYISNQPISVGVTCVKIKDGKKQFWGTPKDQISCFFDNKKDEPKEVIVTVEYTDIAGCKCPAKKFRVFVENSRIARLYGTAKIDCQPLKN